MATLLDTILEHNRSFVRGRQPRPLPAPEALRLAVVTCYDPRLDDLISSSLGLEPGRAIVLRTAGAAVHPTGDPVRSVALAVFLFGVREVIVVGHTSCRMASFTNASFIESFRARGVPREAFGPRDLREWAGAITDPRRGVRSSVAAIASAPFLPRDLGLAGLVLDDETGALEVVVPPGTAARQAYPSKEARAEPAAEPEPSARAEVAAASRSVPPVIHPSPAGVRLFPPPDLDRELETIRSFVETLESTAGWREELVRLRQEMARHRNPLVRLTLLEQFLRKAAGNARGVAAAFERLRKESASVAHEFDPEDLLELVLRTKGGRPE